MAQASLSRGRALQRAHLRSTSRQFMSRSCAHTTVQTQISPFFFPVTAETFNFVSFPPMKNYLVFTLILGLCYSWIRYRLRHHELVLRA